MKKEEKKGRLLPKPFSLTLGEVMAGEEARCVLCGLPLDMASEAERAADLARSQKEGMISGETTSYSIVGQCCAARFKKWWEAGGRELAALAQMKRKEE